MKTNMPKFNKYLRIAIKEKGVKFNADKLVKAEISQLPQDFLVAVTSITKSKFIKFMKSQTEIRACLMRDW